MSMNITRKEANELLDEFLERLLDKTENGYRWPLIQSFRISCDTEMSNEVMNAIKEETMDEFGITKKVDISNDELIANKIDKVLGRKFKDEPSTSKT